MKKLFNEYLNTIQVLLTPFHFGVFLEVVLAHIVIFIFAFSILTLLGLAIYTLFLPTKGLIVIIPLAIAGWVLLMRWVAKNRK